MICREIIEILEEHSPLSYALDWDNSGFLAGDMQREIKKVYVALDAVDEVVDSAVYMEADLLLTHHPLIFGGVKNIVAHDFIGRRLMKLIKFDIAYYAMHTNFDVMGMADLSAAMLGLEDTEVLEVTASSGDGEEGIGRVGEFSSSVTLAYCAEFVKAAFSVPCVKQFGKPDRMVSRVAICPGSGKSVIKQAMKKHADVLITGDIDHHDGIDAASQGLCIIDAGHYGLEHIFVDYMKEYLESRCEDLQVIGHDFRFPYRIV